MGIYLNGGFGRCYIKVITLGGFKMVPPIVQLIGVLGDLGLRIMDEIDDPLIDKRLVKNAITVTEILKKIPTPESLGFKTDSDRQLRKK